MDSQTPIEESQTPAQNKKVLMIAIGVIVVSVIILFVVITVFTANSNKQQTSLQTTTKQAPAAISKNAQGSPDPSQNIDKIDKVNTYKNSFFSIDYPLDWQTEELIFTGGARGLGIKPTLFLTNPEKPNITISVNDAVSLNNLQKSESMYSNMGFKRESIKINNLIATKFSGSIPKKTESVSTTTKFLQTGYVILEQRGSSYLFDYSYINPEVDSQLEAIFEKIISSLNAY